MTPRDFLHARLRSFSHAFRGVQHVMRTQHNAWIHAAVSIAVIAVALWLGLPARDWAVLILIMVTVWAAEFFNSALEAVVDLASPREHHLARIGKDVGAAAVLITAVAAVLIGLLILGPSLWNRILGWVLP